MLEEAYVFPISRVQNWLWLLDRMLERGSCTHNLPVGFRLSGPLNLAILGRSFNEIIRRHEALRTSFMTADGSPVQVIAPELVTRLPLTDLRGLDGPEKWREIERLGFELGHASFDLVRGPLWKTSLLRLDDEDHILLLVIHHIIFDGWSTEILFGELTALYQSYSAGQPSPLPPLPIQYAEYAHWEREYLQGEVLADLLAYWKRKLGGLEALRLPSDHPRLAGRSGDGRRRFFKLPAALFTALKTLSRQSNCTLFMTTLAAFKVLMRRYTSQDDIVVACPFANRNQVELESVIGYFAPVLVLRTDLSGDPSFRDLLPRVRETTLGAMAHPGLPLENLIDEIRPECDSSGLPIFQVLFQLKNIPCNRGACSDLNIRHFDFDPGTAKLDLSLDLVEDADGLSGFVEYPTALFEPTTIERMIGHYQTILESIVADPTRRLSDLAVLTSVERQQLLVDWSGIASTQLRETGCLNERFEAQAARFPEAPALITDREVVSYGEVNRRANRLARQLVEEGVGPESLVAILLERSPDLIVAALAILKAGGAYLVLDASDSSAHLTRIWDDCRPSWLVTHSPLESSVSHRHPRIVCLDRDRNRISRHGEDNLPERRNQDSLAYVVYSSGSAADAKGVAITHRRMACLIEGGSPLSVRQEDCVGLVAASSSPMFSFEIWATLLNGAQLSILPRFSALDQDGGQFAQLTSVCLPATWFNRNAEQVASMPHLRQVLVYGAPLSPIMAQKTLRSAPSLRMINGFSLAENTALACCYTLDPTAPMRPVVPIGRPLAGTQAYVLDENQKPLPIGVPGELYVGGHGLARGYLNRLEPFIAHPFSGEPGARLFRTGDRARWLPDGNLEYLGQVSRIKPAAIEAVLRQHPAIRDAAVLIAGEQLARGQIVAYVVPDDAQSLALPMLRRFLKKRLPKHLVPSRFVTLDTLPLANDGKVDTQALTAGTQLRTAA